MSNGNGVQLDSNPLWTWIRPAFVIAFGVLAFVILAIAGGIAVLNGDKTTAAEVAVIGLAFIGFAFGIRSLDKMLATGINLGANSVGNKVNGTPPKANGGQSTSTTEDDVSAVEEESQTWDGRPPVSFDRNAFMREVMDGVAGQYGGEVNDFTIYAEAQTKLEGVAASWQFNNMPAYKESRLLLLELAEKAFAWKWGVSFDTALINVDNDAGCTTCGDRFKGCQFHDIDSKAKRLDPTGLGYYVTLREVRRMRQEITDLE